jgi:hypothetical protein
MYFVGRVYSGDLGVEGKIILKRNRNLGSQGVCCSHLDQDWLQL